MIELFGKRVFVTGGTGFFGKWLLSLFHILETDVVVLSRNPGGFLAQFPMVGNNSNITFIQGDVRDFTFPVGHFDTVIHAATEASVKPERENPDEIHSVIIDGTKRILEFSNRAGAKRLLYVSSGAVYGVQPPELSHIPETFPCNPVTVYGKGKLEAERMCLESEVETVIARCFAFVGPWLPLDAHFAIGNFIGNCLRNEPIVVKGDGIPMRSYLYGEELAKWLLTLLVKGQAGEAYNVGSDDAISIADLAAIVREIAGSDNEIRVQRKAVQGARPARYIPAIDKIRDELALQVKCGLTESISNTIRWYRERDCNGLQN